MLRQRLIVAFLLIPILVGTIVLGGPVYVLAAGLVFGISAWEYARLFRAGAQRPAQPLLIVGVPLIMATACFPALNPHGLLFVLLILAALAWHLFDFEAGAATSGTDFCVTVAGLFYLGWLGWYFVSLRFLPQGMWWVLAAAATVSLADSGAYIFGRLWGKHTLAPRLSPNKTWEGYAGGVVFSAAGGALFGVVFRDQWAGAASQLTWQTGLLLGLLVGLLGPLGDLGVSMLKRQVGVKDTGRLLPGHGGMFDRIDSWLVAVPLAYCLVWLLQK